jgi:hypothetical protein
MYSPSEKAEFWHCEAIFATTGEFAIWLAVIERRDFSKSGELLPVVRSWR